jgi:hypothetical protein
MVRSYSKKLKRPPTVREDGVIEIHLTRGYVALIDAIDAKWTIHNWLALCPTPNHIYAANGFGVLLHRCILDAPPGHDVDHRNGNTLDCRRENLRIITHQENLRNRKVSAINTSGYTGVCFKRREQKWQARLGPIFLGMFDTAEEANAARLKAEAEQWGIHPRREEAHRVG